MVNRRQLLKLSALGTASFAAPLAYSASNITMAYSTGNPIGSTSPKDLYDNAQNLDLFVNGSNPSYPDRLGVPRKTWKGMEGEFDEGQAERVVEFNHFLERSGYETPVDYAPGIPIIRVTQQVRYLSELYRPKDTSIPFVTTTFPADAAKWVSNGDNALRQELSVSGAALSGFVDSKAPAYLKTVSDILNAGAVSVMRNIPRTGHAALYDGTSVVDYTSNLNEIMAAMIQGGELTLPPVTFNTVGLQFSNARNLKITGSGWKSKIKNNSVAGAHGIWVCGDTVNDRSYGLDISSLTLEGNALSGDGLRLDRLGWYDAGTLKASVSNFDKLKVLSHGGNGIQIGKSSIEGAGNSVNIIGSLISGNGRTGVVGIGQTNLISVDGCSITLNARDGVELNQVASTNLVTKCLIADNTRYGVFAFRCEQPMVTHNGFNRNMEGGVAFSGDPTGSIKYTEAGLIFDNLFGDNGRSAAISREVSLYATKGSNVLANYFYGTGQNTMIYLCDYCEGIAMRGNHFKDLTTEKMLDVKVGAINTTYTFDDDVDVSTLRNIMTNKTCQYVIGAGIALLQTRAALGDAAPRFLIKGDGRMSWSSGVADSDVHLERLVAGSLTCSGGLQAQTLMITDGIALPNAAKGMARIFVDAADGLAKIRFSNGVVRTFTVT